MVTGDPGVLGAHVTQSMKIVSYMILKWLRGHSVMLQNEDALHESEYERI